jgi:hypothetical protein
MSLERNVREHDSCVFSGYKAVVVKVVHFESHFHPCVHVTQEHLYEVVYKLILVYSARLLLIENVVEPVVNDSR